MSIETPWGPAQSAMELAEGITFYSTASHGGIHLSPERETELQSKFNYKTFGGSSWYEEDLDYNVVVLAFPNCFPIDVVARSLRLAFNEKQYEEQDQKDDGCWHKIYDYAMNSEIPQMLATEVMKIAKELT